LGQISLVFTARGLGAMIAAPLLGRLFDRLPGHPIIAGVLILMSILLALVPVINILWLLITVLFLLGLIETALDVGGNTLLVWVHGAKVAPFMNGLHFFFGIGAFLAPVIVARTVLLTNDINVAYWVLALLLIPVAAALLRLPSPADPNTATSLAPATAGQPAVEILPPATPQHIFLVALFFLLYVGAEVSFSGWVYSYALAFELANEVTAAYLTSVFWLALAAGRLLAVPISIFLRPRWILLGDLLGCLLSMGLILLQPNSLIALGVGTAGLGLFMASIFPTTLTLAERRMQLPGRVTGWFWAGAALGAMSIPWLNGQLFERVGPQAVMICILVVLLLDLLTYAVLIAATEKPLEPAGTS
jgi:FHS family Na+ dependent glucose MFS transporter 1